MVSGDIVQGGNVGHDVVSAFGALSPSQYPDHMRSETAKGVAALATANLSNLPEGADIANAHERLARVAAGLCPEGYVVIRLNPEAANGL
jgi:hypothetical protein